MPRARSRDCPRGSRRAAPARLRYHRGRGDRLPVPFFFCWRPLYRAGRIKRAAERGASIIPFCSQLPEIGGNRRAPALAQRKSDRLLWTSPTRGLEMIVLLSPSSNAFQETAYGDVSSRKSRAAIALW